MLISNVRIRGKHKISDKWEAAVHVVVSRAGTLPVYTVKPENRDGPLRTLHQDLLLPCGYLPTEDRHPPSQSTKRRPSTRANPAPEEPTFSDNEEDEIIPVYWFRNPSRDQVPPLQSRTQCGPEMSTEQEAHGLMLSFEPLDHLVESPPNVQRVDLPEDDHTPVRPDYTVDVPLVPDDHPADVVQSTTGVAAPAESVRLTEGDCPDIQSDDVPDTTTDTETVDASEAHGQVNPIRRST